LRLQLGNRLEQTLLYAGNTENPAVLIHCHTLFLG
jgi:hypothetical protein